MNCYLYKKRDEERMYFLVSAHEKPEVTAMQYEDQFLNFAYAKQHKALMEWMSGARKEKVDRADESRFRELVFWQIKYLQETEYQIDVDKILSTGFKIDHKYAELKSGCCGRCDGVNDICDNNGRKFIFFVDQKPEVCPHNKGITFFHPGKIVCDLCKEEIIQVWITKAKKK